MALTPLTDRLEPAQQQRLTALLTRMLTPPEEGTAGVRALQP